MHHNEAYGYSDPAQLSVAPGIHGDKIEMKRITSVSGDQMNVAGSTSHTDMESEYYCIDAPVSSKSHQVESEFKARTRSFAREIHLTGSQMKLQKRFSMDYNKLKHHTGTQALDATHSTLEQDMEHYTTLNSPLEQEMESKVATLSLALSARKSPDEYSSLSLPLRKGRCDASQQMQHNQEQSCHEEAQTSLAMGEPAESIEQEKKISIPKVLINLESNDDSNPPLQKSKLIA